MARIDKIVFLGTGSAVPVPGQRNMSSLAVTSTTGASILVDCGEGTQHHLKVSTLVRSSRIEAILLTHLHGDHCYGIFGLLSTMAMEGRREPVVIAGPAGLKNMVEAVFRGSGGWRSEETFRLEFLEIPNSGTPDGEDLMEPEGTGFARDRCIRAKPVNLGVWAGLTITAVPLVHGLPDWGYVMRESDRPGNLDAEKAISLGVPAKSPLLGKLKKGEVVELPDGRTVRPEEVVGPTLPGRTIAVLQDTSDASGALSACRNADCVIHEATFEAAMEEEAISKGHSTSTMAARFAAACGAKRLVLTHFSARYSTSGAATAAKEVSPDGPTPTVAEQQGLIPDPAEKLGSEAQSALGPTVPVVVAKDFMVLRGDLDFQPEPQLAIKRFPWHRPVFVTSTAGCSCCGEKKES